MKLLPFALLLCVLACGFALRMAQGLALQLAPGESSTIPSRWLIDDPDTCLHLRRAELALHLPRASERDGFMSHPDGAEAPWLPLYDTLVAGYAGNLLREKGASDELAGVHEERLERVAVRLGPFIGLFAILAVWAAVRAAVEGARREGVALLAAGLVAFAPGAVAASAGARLDLTAWCALTHALTLWMVIRTLRATETRETLLAALFAGAASGLACASFLPGVVFFFAGAAALYAHAWRLEGDARRNVLRAGLLYCFVTAFAGQLPPSGIPDQPFGHGELARVWEVALQVPMLAGVPFLAGFVLDNRKTGRFFQAVALAVAIAVILYCFPDIVRTLGQYAWRSTADREWSVALFPGRRGLLDAETALQLARTLSALGPILVLAPWAAWARWRAWKTERDPVDVLFLAGSVLGLLAWTWDGGLLAVAVVPLAGLCARAASPVLERLEPARVRPWAAGACLAFAGGAVLAWPASLAGDERTARIELVRALRWMRASTPEAPGWNDPETRGAWGVLATPAAGAAILYHARRPALATPHGLPGALLALRESAGALLSDDPARFVRYARGTGAQYVVASPGLLREAAVLRRLAPSGAPAGLEASVLWQLACATGSKSPLQEHGLELAWRSDANVEIALEDGHVVKGPAASIYVLGGEPPSAPRHELRAR